MLIRDAEIQAPGDGGSRARGDVLVVGSRIAAIGTGLRARPGERVLEAAGGALLPGLHDHHLHLFALAAAGRSLRCGPPEVRDESGLARALRRAAGRPCDAKGRDDPWIRGVGYHESVAGDLDAARLDALLEHVPVRIQHRSGACWIVNGAGLARLGLAHGVPGDAPSGVERDARGRATGRLFRADDWLRERLAPSAPPSLESVGERLVRFGVTGVTDATPGNGPDELAAIEAARAAGALPQRVWLMGTPELPVPCAAGVFRGARKLLLDEARLPELAQLEQAIASAHAGGRPVALHCVTRTELAFATAAFTAVGSIPGDRIEHAAVAPPELHEALAALALCVVVQPNFVRERGDAYLRDVEPHDRPWLVRGRGLVAAGVALGGGTDAPFGDPDPWLAMQAAVDRRTAAGCVLGADEALSPERALALFTTPADDPGGAPRRVAVGEPADLCLLEQPWRRVRDELSCDRVAASVVDGRIAWSREADGCPV